MLQCVHGVTRLTVHLVNCGSLAKQDFFNMSRINDPGQSVTLKITVILFKGFCAKKINNESLRTSTEVS